ncbi:hypothetical protein AAFF_G00310600 [Aldrovandia affinis]|uniref:Uncharacterized protein n=1 Tax=Aldrovandia affinis TaxID=143900 RepID=A0AAD7R8E9_9TELE|nr:hypothetical protein AAFF_G00310600 [Aldrovandia affinis]
MSRWRRKTRWQNRGGIETAGLAVEPDTEGGVVGATVGTLLEGHGHSADLQLGRHRNLFAVSNWGGLSDYTFHSMPPSPFAGGSSHVMPLPPSTVADDYITTAFVKEVKHSGATVGSRGSGAVGV